MFESLIEQVLSNFWLFAVLILIGFGILWHYFGILSNILGSPATGKDKYVLVTGCDRGFGYKIALDLSVSRCKVLAGCLTEDGVKRLTEQPAFKGVAFKLDVTNEGDIQNAVKLIVEKTTDDGLYAVVNNAGILSSGLIDWQTSDIMRKVMEVNFWGTVNVTKAVLPFIKRRKGRIVNISSMAGRVLFGYSTAYSCSKFAVEAFTDGLRYEMKPFGIKCSIIEPGMFLTDILKSSQIEKTFESLWKKQPDETKSEYGDSFVKDLTARYIDMIDKLASRDISKVTSTINHAVLSSNPKARYNIGLDSILLWMPIAVLPTSLSDWMLHKLTPPILPAVVKSQSKKTN